MVLEVGREERGEMQLLFGNGTSPAGSVGHCESSKSKEMDDNSSRGEMFCPGFYRWQILSR